MQRFSAMDKQVSTTEPACELSDARRRAIQKINLQLAALDQPICCDDGTDEYLGIARDLLRKCQHDRKLLSDYRCPADQRIQDFLQAYLADSGIEADITLPGLTFVLDQPGIAAELSLPPLGNHFASEYINSYRVQQGILHNPSKDRRTTKGVFHIVEGGLPVPAGKKAVPVLAFSRLLTQALNPPESLLQLPFTHLQQERAKVWVSLLMRPIVSPEVKGFSPRRSLETRFFAPGGLVANLDFVERIFGNAGDPHLPENDAALDIHGWTGHTGCVVLAPHLTRLTKQSLGLPHYDQASERQRQDGMCWQQEDELYNDGQAFKVVCRDMRGVIFTIIADNYFGYSKKEVKSQISYSANLLGGAEEEHAGGALVFPSYNLGDSFQPDSRIRMDGHNFAGMVELFGDLMEVQDSGYGIDRRYPDIIYVPEDTRIDLTEQTVSWPRDGATQTLKLRANHTYIHPCGYKVRMEPHPSSPSWRLIGTEAESTFCHKPCTVSGGGKSEISKSIAGSILTGPFYVDDIDKDLDLVAAIFYRDYSDRFLKTPASGPDSRSFLSPDRSLGSVIKLLTPSETEYTPEYNQWLAGIPQHVRALAFVIKRFYRQSWGADWRSRFSVDIVNGYPGHELKYGGRKLVASYLRIGKDSHAAWRTYKVRQDFISAEKVQMEDDISASITLPTDLLGYAPGAHYAPSVKLVENCENMLFQRPDDAVHRGLDQQAEADLATDDSFISNFEPLERDFALELMEDAIEFGKYTQPMQDLIRRAAAAEEGEYFVSSAHARLVDGRPSPNMRYLQRRPDLVNPRELYIAEIGSRLFHRIPLQQPVYFPVSSTLPGRRNNPIDSARNIRPLAVYNPIHYQELPELFMDYVCSLTGKSPSTTGAGSEGALTKGPFNALSTTADLNNALVSMILCGHEGFSSAAGYIGGDRRIDHDISMLIPEIWCRIPAAQRRAEHMIEQGYLEPLQDFEHDGQTVRASRLGYRITSQFVHAYLGKIFDNPDVALDEKMLKPETQDMAAFIDGINNIVEAQQWVAQAYFDDGSYRDACPPLQALLSIMATGQHEGRDIDDPAIRAMFTREYLLASDWYRERLEIQQQRDIARWQRHAAYIGARLQNGAPLDEAEQAMLESKQAEVNEQLGRLSSPAYLEALKGTLGADWIHRH